MVLVEGTMLVVVVAGDAEASGGLKGVDAMGDVSVFTVSRGGAEDGNAGGVDRDVLGSSCQGRSQILDEIWGS